MVSKDIIVSQFLQETETWKRTLGFIEEESVILKNRLSQMLSYIDNSDSGAIAKLENFQDAFIIEDESVKLFRKQINNERILLKRETSEDGFLFEDLIKQHKKLRKQFETVDANFNRIRNEFNEYLSAAQD